MALGRSVEELLDTLSYPEILAWAGYYEVEPWGEWRGDARIAQVAAILANSNRDPKKRPEAYKLQDFMLFDKRVEQTVKTVGAKIDPHLVAWLSRKSGARNL